MEDIEKQLARIERKLAREKAARQQAEQLLEQKSRELFQINEQLKEQFHEAQLQQQQLEFLTGLSADAWNDYTISDLTARFVSRAAEFLPKSKPVFMLLKEEKLEKFFVSGDTSNKSEVESFINSLDHGLIFKNLSKEGAETDLADLSGLTEETLYSFAFFVPIYLVNNALGIGAFFYKDLNDIDILRLQTIESARSTISSAIQRRLATQTVKKRYQQLKATYEQLEQVQQQLVQSEKMASLGQLAAGVAHEINNPIGFVLSNYQTLDEYLQIIDQIFSVSQLLISQPSSNHPLIEQLSELWQEEDIDFIRDDLNELMSASHKGLNRVQQIVAGLKTFSHSDSQEMTAVNIGDCIEDAMQMVWNELKYNVELIRDIDPVEPIKGIDGQLQQVFVNLFVNAKQAMADGGVLTIAIKQQSKKVVVSVTDTGSGISEENIKKLFTPFFTTKPVGEGTGLGLSVSFGILQNHNATVDVQSTLGEGTTFVISFPVS